MSAHAAIAPSNCLLIITPPQVSHPRLSTCAGPFNRMGTDAKNSVKAGDQATEIGHQGSYASLGCPQDAPQHERAHRTRYRSARRCLPNCTPRACRRPGGQDGHQRGDRFRPVPTSPSETSTSAPCRMPSPGAASPMSASDAMQTLPPGARTRMTEAIRSFAHVKRLQNSASA